MKVILYMAISIDGMIAKNDDNTDWISEEEWKTYSEKAHAARCIIIGKRTYHILTKEQLEELGDITIVIISKENLTTSTSNHLVAHSPQEALNLLKDFKEVIVAGGSHTNTSFLKDNLIDEIILDIEPVILGEGIPLFGNNNFEKKLKLIEQKNITANEIQLHYNVIK